MFKNYFKIAWRSIIRHKIYTTINVVGLALGVCACIVIYLITNYEFSFDRFHTDENRIYRVVGEVQRSSGEKEFLNSPVSDVAGLQKQIHGFETEAGVHFYGVGVSIPDGNKPAKKFDNRIEGSYAASTVITWPQYFDIFKYQWLAGNAKVLNEPFKVVLSEKRAHIYFGDIPLSRMIGKTVIYDDSLQVIVGGIVKDWTENSDFGYTDFISISTATHSFLKNQIPTDDWSSLSPHRSMAFVKLAKGVTASQINSRFASFIKEHVKLQNPGTVLTMQLQPLAEIHFTTDFHRGDDGDNFRKPYLPALYALMGVALFILIIAAVNFINLSTAQSIQRSKEIGVRKVMGSSKKNIMFQFLTETFVLTAFAVIISVLLVKPVLYFFSDYIPGGITFYLFNLSTLIFLLIVTLLTSLLAGFYPARVLSSYLPVLSLKGAALQKGTEKLGLRKALIIFQFTISLIFIIGAIVIGRQINFMSNADKGFNTDAIITMNNWSDHEGKLKVLANNIKQLPGISKVLLQGNAPMGFAQMIDNYKYKGKEEISMQASAQIGNEDFIPFYQMKVIAGRNMLHSDSLKELVINETLVRTIGFTNPQDAVGKLLYQQGYPTEKSYPIVGVVADFHTGSFHEVIHPTVIENVPGRKFSIAIKLVAGQKDIAGVKKVLSQIEKQWKSIFPETPFDYSFLNESITRLYGQEKKTAWLINVAMSITIFISCMGLFGLGMFTAQRRTKEIGIRKVLGASVANITAMLSKDFVVLIMIATLIASPVAYYFANQWLQDFVYRTTISWWVFAVAGLSAILIALITISFQAIKAAIANPVESLRTE
jgi:putative ABC transport system permease protein